MPRPSRARASTTSASGPRARVKPDAAHRTQSPPGGAPFAGGSAPVPPARSIEHVRDGTVIPFLYTRINPSTGEPYTNAGITACNIVLVDLVTRASLLASTAMTYDATLGGYYYNWAYLGSARAVLAIMTPTRAIGVTPDLAPTEREIVDLQDSFILHRGTTVAATANTLTLATSAPFTADSQAIGRTLVILAGTGVGQARIITAYTQSTRIATVNRNWNTTPDDTSRYIIIATDAPSVDNSLAVSLRTADRAFSHSSTAQAGGASTITLASTASSVNDFYVGAVVSIFQGTGNEQSRLITAYDGATKVATVNRPWSTVPNNTSGYLVMRSAGPLMDASGHVTATALVGQADADLDAVKAVVDAIRATDVPAITTAVAGVRAVVDAIRATDVPAVLAAVANVDADLAAALSTLVSDISNLDGDLAAHEASSASRQTALLAQHAATQGAVSNLDGDLVSHEAARAAMETSLLAQHAATQAAVANVDGDLATHEAARASMQTALGVRHDQTQAAVADLDSDVAAARTAIQGDVAGVQAAVANVDSDLAAHEAARAAMQTLIVGEVDELEEAVSGPDAIRVRREPR